MPFTAGASKTNEQYVVVGSHDAICCWVIDLGHQETEWEGLKQLKRQLIVAYELPRILIEMEDGSLPAIKSKLFTCSMHPKASLRNWVQNWFGKDFPSDEQAFSFDLFKLLGRHCILDFKENKYNAIVPYNVRPASPECKELMSSHAPTTFSFDVGGDIPDHLPDWIKNKIMDSQEFNESAAGNIPTTPFNASNNTQKSEDDIPW